MVGARLNDSGVAVVVRTDTQITIGTAQTGDIFAATLGKPLFVGEKDEKLLLMLTFSGGGTRAASFSYGVLDGLRDTIINIDGRDKRLLDEVDWISGVSGGSSPRHIMAFSAALSSGILRPVF